MRKLRLTHESWPIAGIFTISRGSKTSSEVILAEIEQEGRVGRGECVPYGHYGESIASVMAQLESQRQAIEGGMGRDGAAGGTCRPGRRAMRWTARSGIWRPSSRESPSGRWPACPSRRR